MNWSGATSSRGSLRGSEHDHGRVHADENLVLGRRSRGDHSRPDRVLIPSNRRRSASRRFEAQPSALLGTAGESNNLHANDAGFGSGNFLLPAGFNRHGLTKSLRTYRTSG